MRNFYLILIFLFCGILSAAEVYLKNDFSKNTEGWSSPKYWNGVLVHYNQAMLLKAENKNGKNFGRCSKMLLSDRHLTGNVYSLAFDGRGKGNLKVVCMLPPSRISNFSTIQH